MMEKEETENVLKSRSYRSCISSAYHDVKDNLWTITKKNWKIFLFIAVLQAAISTWNASLSLGINYVGFDMKPVPLTVCGLLAVASDLLLMAAAFRIINGRALAWNIRRAFSTLPATIVFTLACGIVLLIAFVAYAMSSKTPENIPVWRLAVIALTWLPLYLILSVPVTFVYTRYMIEPETKLRKIFIPAYGNAFRSWGFIVVTGFLALLCYVLINMVLCLPDHVLTIVYNRAAYGTTAYGDPMGLPGYFGILKFFTSLLNHSVGIYLTVFTTYVFYYIYQTVSIKTSDRKARRNRKEDGRQ